MMFDEPKKKTVKSTLKSDEVCAIIERCGMSGVTRFVGFGLELEFALLPPPAPAIEPVVYYTDENIKKADIQAKESSENIDIERKRAEMAELVLTDPEEFFDLMKRGELVDEET